jgi:molybdopterin molybdotransferase
LIKKIEEALSADLIITSAGVSVGKYDLVKKVLEEMGLRLLFWKVAIKPGKPTTFGIIQNKPYLGLPGYPVSSMITFELFARPAILKMMGKKDLFRQTIKITILEDIKKKTDRIYYLRAIIRYNPELKGYEGRLTGPQESGILSSMVKANCLLVLPKEVSLIKSGNQVEAMVLKDFFELGC